MNFTPPKKRTHGQCSCGDHPHHPDCPALYPLQPQPGDIPADVRAHMDLILTDRIARLEERLKGYESTSILENDHQSRARRMGREEGRHGLAEEIASMLTTRPEQVPGFLRRIIDGEN